MFYVIIAEDVRRLVSRRFVRSLGRTAFDHFHLRVVKLTQRLWLCSIDVLPFIERIVRFNRSAFLSRQCFQKRRLKVSISPISDWTCEGHFFYLVER